MERQTVKRHNLKCDIVFTQQFDKLYFGLVIKKNRDYD